MAPGNDESENIWEIIFDNQLYLYLPIKILFYWR
mgnify:CR=1 FL=1